MDGVTILSEMSVRGEELAFVIAWIILTIVFIVSKIADTITHWHYSELKTKITSVICTVIFCGLPFMVAVYLCRSHNTFHTEYKVTIDDSVGFNEFTECYEILSNDGDIYTVIERERSNETN